MPTDSILDDTKKMCSIPATDTSFDTDILIHINTVFATLCQIGIGPAEGFMIDDKDAVWADFLGDDLRLNSVKSYMYLRVRMLFDPPATSFTQDAMKQQLQEIEWRLNTHREELIHPLSDYTEEVI